MNQEQFAKIKACVTDCYLYWNAQLPKEEQSTVDDIIGGVNTMSAAEIMEVYKMDKDMWVTSPKGCREPAVIDIYRKHGV